ncbi:MAG: hypothetical protein E7K06_03465 [Corynebacterium sp.]|uniref:hypothetical protein n=1 Tax=Corynebacterium sp. TaxID=1720 RepID=UPI00280BD54C|nr:hypothetical protein [Corynebacterium sp.]MDU3164801.1 hypothetical protein [Corynebacterium sp.]MDU4633171.1 hypothetical protein [Corynebacterium sp.]MDU5327486.1 hypothetical protein [Corynebacterium sp.]MDU6417779.1 hypothetical protein [Corynebacterium sp.]MDU6592936.1 hypothetical protein [Corynebacterium sp.]
MFVNLITGVVSGIISGFLVAIALWVFENLRKPDIELHYLGSQRAVIKNNRFKAVVIGGAWEFENGEVFYRPDGFRGGTRGFYIPRYGDFIVGTSHFGPGQTADVAYKRVKNTNDFQERVRLEEKFRVEVFDVISKPEKFPGWKLARLAFKAGS